MVTSSNSPISDASPSYNLPAEVASFVGRKRETREVKEILGNSRLVTLTGTGGCGKTRLALRVAADVARSYKNGVWLVELAAVEDSAMVSRAVAAALGVRGAPDQPILALIARALASKRLLLVLDNCEHLIGACARIVDELLHAAPDLHVLATSREPLHLPGEVTWRVPSLTVPGPRSSVSPDTLSQVEAVSLFIDRAHARQPKFTLSALNAPSVAAICRHLGGLPLAIELAAGQVGFLTPEQLVSRLDDALGLLRGGDRTASRQATMRATLEWSHALLSNKEEVLFRRLSVFAGSFGLEAVENVATGSSIEPAEILTLFMALIEKSLVEVSTRAQSARYHLLEPVRQYARELLVGSQEANTLEARHARHFLDLAEEAEPRLMSGERRPSMERLAADEDNLRAALGFGRRSSNKRDREIGLRTAAALLWFWNLRGDVSEGLQSTLAALDKAPDASAAARAKALYAASELSWLAGKSLQARALAEESEALYRELDDKRWLAYVLQSLAMAIDHPRARENVAESLRLFQEVGDDWGAALAISAIDHLSRVGDDPISDEVEARLEDGLARWRELGDDWGAATVLNSLGDVARGRNEDGNALARYEESLSLLERQGLTGTVPSLLHNVGYLELRRGQPRKALDLFRDSLARFRDLGDQRGIADCLDGVGAVLSAMKHAEDAARLFGAAETLREVIGASMWPANEKDHDRAIGEARTRVSEAAWSAARADGRKLQLEQAIAQALGSLPSPLSLAWGQLTAREREVAVLVTQGLTNRQIGASLFITEGTARLHVKHILHKLGFSSRARIAAWTIEHRLAETPEAK